jgi:hypothetical protein
VLGIQPPPPVKNLYKPVAKKPIPVEIPPKYKHWLKTYNLEFLRLKFNVDSRKWQRQNGAYFNTLSIDTIVRDWKLKSRFKDAQNEFRELDEETASSDETLEAKRDLFSDSDPPSIRVLQEVDIAGIISKNEISELTMETSMAILEELRREQWSKIEWITNMQMQWRNGGKLNRAQNDEIQATSNYHYAKILNDNLLRRWHSGERSSIQQ